MMEYTFSELIDIDKLHPILESFYKLTGISTAILDLKGNVLVESILSDACAKFHKVNPLTKSRCLENNRKSYANISEQQGKFVFHTCKNGFVDVGGPIIINGSPIATFWGGQFLLNRPDLEFFRNQAKSFNFNEHTYLEAVKKIPVFPKKQVKLIMDFFLQLTKLITEMGYKKLEQLAEQKKLKISEERIKKSESLLAAIIEASADAIVVVGNNGQPLRYNGNFLKMFDFGSQLFDSKQLRKREALIIKHFKNGADIIKNTQIIYEHSEKEWCDVLELKDGRIIERYSKPFYLEGKTMGIVWSYRDITERKQVEEQLKYNYVHDSLTTVYNRTYFAQKINEMETEKCALAGIIVCDIDGLKFVNDTMGHQMGDNLLISASRFLEQCSEGNNVYRIGGDEFAILTANTNEKDMKKIVTRIKKVISQYNNANSKLYLTLSIGFSFRRDPSVSMKDIFKEADNNMYREKLYHSQSNRSAIVDTLMKALEARDFITEGHVDRLQYLVKDMAIELGLSESRITILRLLAQFHDIGKVGIPDSILFKRGPLTQEEMFEMKRHSEIGYRIAQSAPDLISIASMILKHHEHWNGNGYPLGLKGEQIPLECRMLAIADAYDAMTSNRPYRQEMSHRYAIAELRRCAGTQFDSQLVTRFIQMFERKEENDEVI